MKERLTGSGPQALRPAEQVRLLAAALGRELRFEGLSDGQARVELAASFPPAFVEAFLRCFARGEFDGSRVVPTVGEITGRPARTFAQWASAHAHRFR